MKNAETNQSEIRFSYSGLSTFHTCRHGWKLTYLEKEERKGNFYSDYGLLIHETLEKFFRDELESFQLSEYYGDNWDRFIQHEAPYFVKVDEYYKGGYDFFEKFGFIKDDYEIIVIEDKVDVDLEEYGVVVKPDLVIRHIDTGKVILVDYKSSLIRSKDGAVDEKKLNGYKRQMTMYALFLSNIGIDIDEVWIWFIRDEFVKFEITSLQKRLTKKWIDDTIKEIKNEKEFKPTINKFFCQNLCSVSHACSYRPK